MNPVLGQSMSATYPVQAGTYPVDVRFPRQDNPNKLYAIPILGYLIKCILLIPHLIILYVLHAVVGLLQYVLWIPVLLTGRFPDWGHLIVGGTLSWQNRVTAYLFGFTDQYPSFSLADPGTGREAQMLLQPAQSANRLYAFPIVGFVVKSIVLIPHMIMLTLVGIVAFLVFLVSWIPVLSSGQYPEWGYKWLGGSLRWATRVYAYWYGLTDEYPPFRLDS
jgi:hypothetical protein